MKALLAALVVCSATAHADPVEQIIRTQLAPALPADTDIARVYIPTTLAKLDVEDADVTVELPRELRIGRKSVKVTVAGQRPAFVPVLVAALADVAIAEHPLAVGTVITASDVRIETRAAESSTPALGESVIGAKVTKSIATGAIVAPSSIAQPPPLRRGTQVTVEVQRGRVRIRSAGTLELVARPGEQATVRLAQGNTTLRGTLVAPATVVVK